MAVTKNPSSTFFWNDWDNDEALKACSLAAQGLWMRCLCIAARSPEQGVVMIGGFPASRTDIAPRLAAVVGQPLDVVNALIDELLTSGAAGLDRKNRIINRRMVKAAALHKKRSEAGKAGAEASARSRTDSSQAEKRHPEEKGGENDQPPSAGNETINDGLPRQTGRNNPGKTPAKGQANEVASSRLQDFKASGLPIETTSLEGRAPDVSAASAGADAPPAGQSATPQQPALGLEPDGIDDIPIKLDRSPTGEAVRLWNETAERVNGELDRIEWPAVQKLTGARRSQLRARLKDCGGIEGWRIALEKAAKIPWLRGETPRSPNHANWRFKLKTLIGEEFFTNLMEGSYDDDPSRRQQGRNEGGYDPRVAGVLKARPL